MPVIRKHDISRHVSRKDVAPQGADAPLGDSIGFTLDTVGFNLMHLESGDDHPAITYGEMNDLFYLWEWIEPEE